MITTVPHFDVHLKMQGKYLLSVLLDISVAYVFDCGKRCYNDLKCQSFLFFTHYAEEEAQFYSNFTGNCELESGICGTSRLWFDKGYKYYTSKLYSDIIVSIANLYCLIWSSFVFRHESLSMKIQI